jgi:hypothetical protein
MFQRHIYTRPSERRRTIIRPTRSSRGLRNAKCAAASSTHRASTGPARTSPDHHRRRRRRNHKKTPVFWLEYSDLFCRRDATLDRLLAFLGLRPHPLTADSTKLTPKVFNMLPFGTTYRTLANLLATGRYVKEGALRQALYTTDHCGYLRKYYPGANAAFCPNAGS